MSYDACEASKVTADAFERRVRESTAQALAGYAVKLGRQFEELLGDFLDAHAAVSELGSDPTPEMRVLRVVMRSLGEHLLEQAERLERYVLS